MQTVVSWIPLVLELRSRPWDPYVAVAVGLLKSAVPSSGLLGLVWDQTIRAHKGLLGETIRASWAHGTSK